MKRDFTGLPMNPFERHIKENLSGPPQKPEWIRRARRNWKAKVRRYAKKHGVSLKDADEMLCSALEYLMQGTP